MTESVLIITEEGPYTFRVACTDCSEIFDLFGKLEPWNSAKGASTIEQRCCEHLDQCRPDRTKIAEVEILQNKSEPTLYRLTATWTDAA